MLRQSTSYTIFVFCFVLASHWHSYAQIFKVPDFTHVPPSSTGFATYSMVTADLDGDGDEDIITNTGNFVRWYVNVDGTGELSAAQELSFSNNINSFARAIAVGDIDDDGDLDVAIAYYSNELVFAWCENLDGLGSFGEASVIGSTSGNRNYVEEFLSVVDVDLDGNNDIFYSSFGPHRGGGVNAGKYLGWFRNLDRGNSFSSDSLIADNINALSISLDDIDEDDDIDIIFSESQRGLFLIENLGGDTQFAQPKLLNEEVSNIELVHASDIGYYEGHEIVASTDEGELIIFTSSEEEKYQIQDTISTNIFSLEASLLLLGPKAIITGDLNGDGVLDVLLAHGAQISWFIRDSESNTFERERFVNNKIGQYTTDISIADMDGDGENDIIGVSFLNHIVWFRNLGSGDFGNKNSISNRDPLGNINIVDVDGDSDNDIITNGGLTLNSSGLISWIPPLHFNNINGKGKFDRIEIGSGNTSSNQESAFSEDLDNDGDVDVVTIDQNKSTIAWYENTDGNGSYSNQKLITDQTKANYVEFADIDGDGDKDILATTDDEIVWFEHVNGNGIFSNSTVLIEASAYRARIADLDNDGDQDIVYMASAFFNQSLYWIENEGEGIFQSEIEIEANFRSGRSRGMDVLPLDIEADGDLDLVILPRVGNSSFNNSVYWYENLLGKNEFLFQDSFIESEDVFSASLSDFDLDGDYDIVAIIYSDDFDENNTRQVVWYENTNGKDAYAPYKPIEEYSASSESSRFGLTPGDIDSDGDFDLAYMDGQRTFWIENQLPAPTFPKIGRPIPNLQANIDEYFQYTVSELTFYDSTMLTLTASLADGSPLPAWLEFSSNQEKLRGTPSIDNVGIYEIEITATNTKDIAISTVFQLSVGQEVVSDFFLEKNDVSCFGKSDGSITVDVTNSNGSETYSLDNNSFQDSNEFTELTSGTYTVYVKTGGNAYSQELVITEPPELTLSEPIIQEPNCPSDNTGSIEITASGGAGSGYEYSLNGNDFGDSGVFRGLRADIYLITVRDANECTKSLEVTVPSSSDFLSTPTIRRSDESDLVDELSLIAENIPSGAQVQWYRDDIPIPGATDLSVPITEAGSYYVEVSISGCTAVSGSEIITGLRDIIAQNLRVYPVPAYEIITAEIPLELTTGEIQATLMNAQGQILKVKSLSSIRAHQQVSFDVSKLSTGLYLLSLQGEGFQLQRRVTKR